MAHLIVHPDAAFVLLSVYKVPGPGCIAGLHA